MKSTDSEGLEIRYYPDPVLKQTGVEVTAFGSVLEALAKRMIELMHAAKGVGLAAPQVGLSIRLFVCNPTGEPGDDAVYVNPRIVESGGADEAEEGCLSIPGATVTVRRAQAVILESVDLTGTPNRVLGVDIVARIWQHEIDHLNGRLIIDYMSASDEIGNRRVLKQLEADYKSNERNPGRRCASSS